MSEKGGKIKPQTYYLNEKHELARSEKASGGRSTQYVGIDWAGKGEHIRQSLVGFTRSISQSKDPLRKSRYFMLASPDQGLSKASKNKKIAPEGTVPVVPNFSKEHSRIFDRIGLDLIDVTPEGKAIVHGKPEQVDRLISTCESLDKIGSRERARLAVINAFGLIPREYRIDHGWFTALPGGQPVDVVIELQPLLDRLEVEQVIRAIHEILSEHEAGKIERNGTDFSGRHWFRGHILKSEVDRIANYFSSVQSLHSPIFSVAAASAAGSVKRRRAIKEDAHVSHAVPSADLPCIAIVDIGVPRDHVLLAKDLRGQYIAPGLVGQAMGSHGSMVASRVVFGDVDFSAGIGTPPSPSCKFYDINVAEALHKISDKNVVPAMEAVSSTAPDVRVYNLSFDHLQPLDSKQPKDRQECLLLVQDLDNFIFASDAIVVVCAGNSPLGFVPPKQYPEHFHEEQWSLGPWARSFNAMTCGSSVGRLTPGGLVSEIGWPSPFTRIGPGLADSPKVDFSANGGNTNTSFQYAPGLGVWGANDAGSWEDHCGTSFAAPLLARETAFAVRDLQRVCQQGARPFGATVKAFLTLSASRVHMENAKDEKLFRRALGYGNASATRLRKPVSRSAVMIWQGVLENPRDKAEVQIPIPLGWYNAAGSPFMRLVVAWHSPVNAAVHNIWSCRKVTACLRSRPDSRAISGSRGGHSCYPLINREYDLKKLPEGITIEGDTWVIELAYDEIADYHPGMDFTPQQHVGFALELYDDSEQPVSPQSYIQALPIANTMTRLSVPPAVVRTPVIIRSRL